MTSLESRYDPHARERSSVQGLFPSTGSRVDKERMIREMNQAFGKTDQSMSVDMTPLSLSERAEKLYALLIVYCGKNNLGSYFETHETEYETFIDTVLTPALQSIDNLGSGLGGLTAISLSGDILSLFYSADDGDVKYLLPLSEVFRSSGGILPVFDARVVEKVRQQPVRLALDTLRDDLDTESYFGGAAVVTYSKIKGLAGEGTDRAVSMVVGTGAVAGVVDIATYNIKRILYR